MPDCTPTTEQQEDPNRKAVDALLDEISFDDLVDEGADKITEVAAEIPQAEEIEILFTADDFHVSSGKWKKLDKYQALYDFGFDDNAKPSTPKLKFLHFIAEKFVECIPSLDRGDKKIPDEVIRGVLNAVPFTSGTEFINAKWIENIFEKLTEIFTKEISSYHGTLKQYITEKSIKVPEKIFFHLVENKKSRSYPFAFLATYAATAKNGGVRHVPLSYALRESQNEKLLSLMTALDRASQTSPLIHEFFEKGELFYPLKLNQQEAYDLLKAIPALEEKGICCRIPNWWKKKASSIRLSVKFEKKSKIGFSSMLSMSPELSVDGITLSPQDIKSILAETNGLAFIKGKWIEADKKHLQELLDKMNDYRGEISFTEALRLRLEEQNEISFRNEDFLSIIINKLSNADKIEKPKLPDTVKACLRPYQISGYAWLNLMAELGLGACLADDMGLGKTLEVLTFLENLRKQNHKAKILLIVPASLLCNWENEAEKFTPKLPLHILHGRPKEELEKELETSLRFLNVTTYATAMGLEGLQKIHWDAVILDEAQAIKNPDTKQTKAIKKLTTDLRIVMTGTPVENNLSNLWSLFDFANKGLLGTAEEFQRYSQKINEEPEKLRNLVAPFILRRLKTDKSIIADLPDKIETIEYVTLSQKQIILYREQVKELEKAMSERDVSTIQRSGMILSTITKLKQICNHPDQFLGLEPYVPSESGKFEMLKEICETIHENHEKVLVFTQFREIMPYLAHYLSGIFHSEGLIIHGGTQINRRAEIVDTFNNSNDNPFMVLSLKTAGVGLNLVGANHVIHFDRWWNPAVENQATDRAFRIGQTKDVIVHKFVAKGTIEERIDEIIESKKSLAENVIGENERWITNMNNQEVLSLLSLK